MKRTIDVMKRISGSTESDRKLATDFCREALSEASTRLDRLKSVCDLGEILDAQRLAIAADDRAGIRHIHACVQGLVEFHQRGSLSNSFDATLLDLGKMQDEAEGLYRWLHMLYSRD